jgi:glycosyltransferase involved in cell wall biosynthesis
MMQNDFRHPFFTIFTPVFNGEKHIHRVFKSILGQTFKNFEWIIINDGSTDNTSTLIKAFIKDSPEIEITYLEQENSGKHISWNKAVNRARGVLFVPADADDFFFPETLSFFHEKWNNLNDNQQNLFSGINVLCLDNDSANVVGNLFPVDGMRTNNLELAFKYKLKGEKWGCIRTDVLQARPFPIVKGSHFPEGYLWFHLSKNYKVLCFNKPLRRYYTTETGLIQSDLKESYDPAQNKVKMRYYFWLIINFGFYMLRHSPESFLKSIKILIKSTLKSLKAL